MEIASIFREKKKKTRPLRNPPDGDGPALADKAGTIMSQGSLPRTAALPRPDGQAGPAARPPSTPLNPDESRIIAGLSPQQVHIDSLAQALGMDVSQLSGLLTMLEMRGLVRRAPGMIYSLP